MEGRIRRGDVRIAGVAEKPGSSSVTAVSKLLTEVLQMDRDLKADRAYHSLAPKRSDGRPRVIIAKMHHDQDCMEILKRAIERAPLRLGGEQISIYLDFTARATFNDVRKMLRGCQAVRYGLIFPARLRIMLNGEDQLFLEPAKAMVCEQEHNSSISSGKWTVTLSRPYTDPVSSQETALLYFYIYFISFKT